MKKSIYTPEHAAVLGLLRKYREQAGMTQHDLAERLGVSQSFVTKMECGDRRIDIVQLLAICHVHGSTLLEFVTRLEKALAKRKQACSAQVSRHLRHSSPTRRR